MYLSAYHFEGDPDALVLAHDRLTAQFPPEALSAHLCIQTPRGILVLDGCPSRAVAEAFAESPDLASALAAAGLPTPRFEPLGELWSSVGVA